VADFLTKSQRSRLMSAIHGHGNKDTEIALAKLFRRNKITCWRRNQKIFGKPYFIFPKIRLALFVDGCFWHVCAKARNATERQPGGLASKVFQ
jgi:DNA mismatch endonuclease (patch repair protein)